MSNAKEYALRGWLTIAFKRLQLKKKKKKYIVEFIDTDYSWKFTGCIANIFNRAMQMIQPANSQHSCCNKTELHD